MSQYDDDDNDECWFLDRSFIPVFMLKTHIEEISFQKMYKKGEKMDDALFNEQSDSR